MNAKDFQRILIIKLGAIGDVLRTTSILYGLKQKYPNSTIHWLTKLEAKPLLIKNVYINKLLVIEEDLKEIIENSFDIIINLDEDLEACSLVSKLNGEKIGFYLENNKIKPSKNASEWYNMSSLGEKPKNNILKKNNKKTYQQILKEILEINPKHMDISIRLTQEQKDFATRFARQFNIEKNDLVIGLNTGSGIRWPKDWSIENTAKLTEIIHKELNAKILLFGGKNEIERNNQIIAKSKAPIIHCGCGNDLFEFPALISLCDLIVTSDSLGMHIAIALKRKIIVLFGPTSSNEIELYNLGKKLTPKEECKCFYENECRLKKRCIDTISPLIVFKELRDLIKKPKISIIITSFKEPNLEKCIESILKQKIDYEYELLIVSPDKEAETIAKKYSNKNTKYIKDPGKGKSYALNLVTKEASGDILILTDGDVYLNNNAINEIAKEFEDPIVGCVGGRVVSSNPKDNMLGFWSHLLADAGAHNSRLESSKKGFIECSGYLFAYRNNMINNIPLDVAEDTFIPYTFWEKGYEIRYAEKAIVYVKNPTSIKDWIKQRKRTAKAHETLDKYVDTKNMPRVKTFWNEIRKGTVWALAYPKNIKEFFWTLYLFPTRLYMWISLFLDIKIKKQTYQDGWERVESTKEVSK